MPFRLRWRRSKATQIASQKSVAEHGYPKDRGSLIEGPKDEQCEANAGRVLAETIFVQPSSAHGASPCVTMDSKPSLFRRTLSNLSPKIAPKVNADSSEPCGNDQGGDKRGNEAEGSKNLVENNVRAESGMAKRAHALHNFLPRFYGAHHQQTPGAATNEDSGEHGVHPAHMPLHLPHLHLPHILESRSHHQATHHDGPSAAEFEAEVMKMLQSATDRAKGIIEAARGEREILMSRARLEAEDEIKDMRHSLEREFLQSHDTDDSEQETLRVATTKEEELMRQILQFSEKNMEVSVALCVDSVLNVDISLPPERRDALRNLKRNPPNFFRKSQAHNYPSVRNSLAQRATKTTRGLGWEAENSWDQDPRDILLPTHRTDEQPDVYAAILGGRALTEEDRFQIDFDELELTPAGTFSATVQHLQRACGCLLG
ncbi:uncharacterized protein LOC34622128 [Cyclospora cayetanensis]|uniref:Uncharacterized protein LOC34622128 n=1 Tax=Cyclospora cayetanensis TaxID=88456 RepID=A0A6P6RYM7_9EIME|nr:uncharacterized protein LOC34622128 [Cyclospora cayetanensis]